MADGLVRRRGKLRASASLLNRQNLTKMNGPFSRYSQSRARFSSLSHCFKAMIVGGFPPFGWGVQNERSLSFAAVELALGTSCYRVWSC